MMKKMLSVGLILAMVLSLAACTGKSKEVGKDDEKKSKSSDGSYEIAIVPKDTTNDWFQCIAQGGEKFGKEKGCTVYMKGGTSADASLQIEVIEDLIASGVDALCVIPNDIDALESVLKKAQDAGIVVVTHEASTQKNTEYDLEAFDNAQFGATIMDSLASQMEEKGQYCVMVGSLTNGSHNEWADGGIARQEEEYPDMELVGDRIEIKDNSETAYEKAKEMLKTYPELKGFFGTAAQCVPGVARAIEELGLAGKVSLCGMALPSAAGEYIERGTMETIVAWDPYEVGYAMSNLAYMILSGEEIKEGINLGAAGYEDMNIMNDKVLVGSGFLEITKDNLKDYDF